MTFLYSRKLQLILLSCWLLGMGLMFTQITGEGGLLLVRASAPAPERPLDARLGHIPAPPALADEPKPEPAPPPRPVADPRLNRFLALRFEQAEGEHQGTLVLDMDYVAAQTHGFSADKIYSYYLDGEPTFVIALGEPWVSDIGNISLPGAMPQVKGINLIVSKSQHLRLLVHTNAMHVASGARLEVSPTSSGLRAEVRLPR